MSRLPGGFFATLKSFKKTQKTTFFNVVFYSSTKAPISSTNENWIKWDIFKIYIYVTVILTFKKGLILMKKADK